MSDAKRVVDSQVESRCVDKRVDPKMERLARDDA